MLVFQANKIWTAVSITDNNNNNKKKKKKKKKKAILTLKNSLERETACKERERESKVMI
jgi:hypothetical protein